MAKFVHLKQQTHKQKFASWLPSFQESAKICLFQVCFYAKIEGWIHSFGIVTQTDG